MISKKKKKKKKKKKNNGLLSRRPPTGDSDPLIEAASLLALNINNVSITLASASHTVFFDRVPCLPVFIFFLPLLLIARGHLKEWRSCQLTVPGSVRRAMLDSGMTVSNVAKIMNILGS